jgi:uncharacterized protein (TIGR00369 family)
MRKELVNPYEKEPGFNCFGCSEHNHEGLKMKFFETETGVESEWKPDKKFEGYFNVLHGGIQATMLDEIASWVINMKLDTAGVTSKMEIEYLKPVSLLNEENIRLEAKIESVEGNTAIIQAVLFNSESVICTKAKLHYFVYPREIACRRLKFSGKDAFYPQP